MGSELEEVLHDLLLELGEERVKAIQKFYLKFPKLLPEFKSGLLFYRTIEFPKNLVSQHVVQQSNHSSQRNVAVFVDELAGFWAGTIQIWTNESNPVFYYTIYPRVIMRDDKQALMLNGQENSLEEAKEIVKKKLKEYGYVEIVNE